MGYLRRNLSLAVGLALLSGLGLFVLIGHLVVDTSKSRPLSAAAVRAPSVEHPFGTIKAWMGATHFLMRTLPKVSTEMALHVLAYNIKRAISILGTLNLIEAIRT